MHIKKFEGRDLRDALARIRTELGPEAVILETGQNGGGGVSVLAALPRTEAEAEPAAPPRRGVPTNRVSPNALPANGTATSGASWNGNPASGTPTKGLPTRPTFPRVTPPIEAPAPASTEVEELQERLRHLNRLVRSDHFSAVPLPLRQIYFDLTDAEVDAHLVFQILQRMGNTPLPGQFTSAPPGELLHFLQGLVQVGGTVAPGRGRRVIALVGPTGVGKTTTVAKIAGQAAFKLGREVALLTTDAYRVFGAQHLSSYAALMGIPFDVVTTAAEMRWLLEGRFAGTDLILIDTSGRSPRDPRGIEEIHQLLSACPDLDVHLVLAANTRARDLALALDSFSLLPVRHLLFTKLDEATSAGGIFTTALKARRPVSYLGTGQEVPDDLTAATTAMVTQGILGGEHA